MAIARASRSVPQELPVPAAEDAPAAKPVGDKAAKASSHLSWQSWLSWTVTAVVIALGAYFYAYFSLLPDCARSTPGTCAPGQTYAVASDVSIFAAIFVIALAIERLLSPLSRWLVPSSESNKDTRDQAATDLANGTGTVQALANAQAEVDRDREKAVIIHWGVSIALSFLLAGQVNVLLLATIKAADASPPAAWVDLLVTGLVLGAGTKPLHDLVAKIEKSKEAQQDPAESGGKA